MTSHSRFTLSEARAAGERIGIDWDASPFGLEEFRKGMNIELEHGTRDPETNVTDDDVTMTAKMARAHLNEFRTIIPALRRWKPRRKRRRTAPRRVTEAAPEIAALRRARREAPGQERDLREVGLPDGPT